MFLVFVKLGSEQPKTELTIPEENDTQAVNAAEKKLRSTSKPDPSTVETPGCQSTCTMPKPTELEKRFMKV